MKILCIDTSTSAGSIALVRENRLLGELLEDSPRTHSARLLAGIDALLKNVNLSISDVDVFAVISGPGSFTGIRIGLTTVKGLAEALGKPIVPITSFEAWVEKEPAIQGILVPLIPARLGEIYAAVYERSGSVLNVLSDGIVGEVEGVISRMSEGHASFIGRGAAQYWEVIQAKGEGYWTVVETDPFLGQPMARIAHQRASRGEFCTAQELTAFYLRRSDAEIHWKER